jgi:hypothetical protein
MKLYNVGTKKTKRGKVKTENSTPPKHPVIHSFMASKPLPCKSSLCPGKTPKAVDSSGAPSKIAGIKLMKELTTPDVTKTIAVGIGPNKNDKPRTIGTILFGCNPGNKPAIKPRIIPNDKAKNNSNI